MNDCDLDESLLSALEEKHKPLSEKRTPGKTFTAQFNKRLNKSGSAAELMREVLLWLEEREIPYETPTPYQVKIGSINYYPKRGVIMIDGDSHRRPETGLKGLESLLDADRIETSFGAICFTA